MKGYDSCYREHGFTLVESLIALLIFSIGFSGLYFFYAIAQQTIGHAEKRMGINFATVQIIENLISESRRSSSDPLNPFNNFAQYSGNLIDCSVYDNIESRKKWCQALVGSIGPYNSSSGNEMRQVDITKDGTNLIVNISIVADNGLVSTYYSRKLRQK